MPGPGGGSHGGGGHRGGGFGGSSHSGGFGGPRGGFYGPHMGGFGWHHRPRYYGGGGCLSGLLGMVMTPIIVVVFLVVFLAGSCSNGIAITEEDGLQYNEETFQDFADEMYADEFHDSTAYEDNLLLVVLTDDDYYEYHYIAWVGDHIDTDINYLFGNEETELGEAMANSINETNYKYSLDSNLAQVIDTMTKEITDLGLESSFKCDDNHVQVESHLTNKSDVSMTQETVNEALQDFTEKTGISFVIVVEDMDDVF